MVFRKVRN